MSFTSLLNFTNQVARKFSIKIVVLQKIVLERRSFSSVAKTSILVKVQTEACNVTKNELVRTIFPKNLTTVFWPKVENRYFVERGKRWVSTVGIHACFFDLSLKP